MTRHTIVDANDLKWLDLVPSGSRLVLDFGRSAYDRKVVDACNQARLYVDTMLVRVSSLGAPLLQTFTNDSPPVVVIHTGDPAIDEALASAGDLARPHWTVELPLRTERHATVLKLLSSLGVRTRVDPRALSSGTQAMREVLTDAMVRPGRRAPVSPFAEIVDRFSDDTFEIGQLEFCANDHFVDLRSAPELPGLAAWNSVDVLVKRIPLLLARHPCAFCEGLLFCHGYLYTPDTAENCRSLFSDLAALHGLSLQRREAQQRRSAGSSRSPRPEEGPGARDSARGGKPC